MSTPALSGRAPPRHLYICDIAGRLCGRLYGSLCALEQAVVHFSRDSANFGNDGRWTFRSRGVPRVVIAVKKFRIKLSCCRGLRSGGGGGFFVLF